MSLRRALKSIIEWKNVSILYDSSLIKLLNDYDAFAEYPSSENVSFHAQCLLNHKHYG